MAMPPQHGQKLKKIIENELEQIKRRIERIEKHLGINQDSEITEAKTNTI